MYDNITHIEQTDTKVDDKIKDVKGQLKVQNRRIK